MKINYQLAFLLLSGYLCHSQNDQVFFDFDVAGNQITRELICITCDNPMRQANPGFAESRDYEKILYFPNPVLEELQVQWPISEKEVVTSLDVYSLNGQLVQSQNIPNQTYEAKLNFKELAQGMYTVILKYKTGTTKDLKVIKK